jgi:hypothetical protein
MQNKDEENLDRLREIAGGLPYNPGKWWTCASTFVPSFEKVERHFIPEGPWKQVKVPEKDLYKYAFPKRFRR